MSERQLICIGCPLGCMLTATLENGAVTAVNAGNKHIRHLTGPQEPRRSFRRPGRSLPAHGMRESIYESIQEEGFSICG